MWYPLSMAGPADEISPPQTSDFGNRTVNARVLIEAARAAGAVLAEHAGRHDRDASFPAEGLEAAAKSGLLSATAATRYGGAGLGVEASCRLLAELGAGDPSAALVVSMTLLHHAFHQIAPSWPEEVYRRSLTGPDGVPVLVNDLRVEPDLGTPARGGLPATIARRTPEGWRLSGRKIYSTGSHALTWMAVYARTDEPVPRVGRFLVLNRPDLTGFPADPVPGITIEPTWDHLGLRASASHDVVFTDVLVPEGSVAGLVEAGTQPLHASAGPLAGWGLVVPALYLGVARAAQQWLVGFLHSRVPSSLGAPLATLPRFRTAVGEVQARILTAEELLFGLARRVDGGDPDAAGRAGTVKTVATRELIAAVEQAVSLVGNPGLTRANPLQRHLRDILCSRVHTPQDDVVLLGLGRSVLAAGAPAGTPAAGSPAGGAPAAGGAR
jgi:alkylation response protein AidB-like acyl-CoA dehydrogenase